MPTIILSVLSALGISQKALKWVALGVVVFAILTIVGASYAFVSGMAHRAENYAAQLAVEKVKEQIAIQSEKMVRERLETMKTEFEKSSRQISLGVDRFENFQPTFDKIPDFSSTSDKKEKANAPHRADAPTHDFARINRMLESAGR